MNDIFSVVSNYGVFIIFILIFLENLNTPGLAAGILLGGVGVIAKKGDINIIIILIICLIAALLANIILYLIGKYAGSKVIEYLVKKIPKFEKGIEKVEILSRNAYGRISTRFIPGVRTLTPLIEGGIGIKFSDFIKTAIVGVFGFNLLIIMSGYIAGGILM
ncbi:VTT domain-containing protein [uncultured Clostridium sp.]|uniref:DedA family protein n=1 Tax=uncultured Clostridium sp. TaxID=59620 RepID=UPI002613D12D|nr:VTT domain-containing protein [uncultured Clostridium sp.]